MIRFSCKQCGKKHSRSEAQSGSLVFCTCGQANRVPWESEFGEEEPPPAESEPRRRSIPNDERDTGWRSPPERMRDPRRDNQHRRDDSRCLNHQQIPATQQCADCVERFCDNCVVKVQGRLVCGPCKNFQIRTLSRPGTPSLFAILSLVLGLLGCPAAFCISAMGLGVDIGFGGATLGMSAMGMVLPTVALFLGIKAMIDTGNDAKLAGRSLAITGVTASLIGIFWCLAFVVFSSVRLALPQQ